MVATFANATMKVSGAQFNPVITIGLLITQKMTVLKAILYIIIQCLAGLVAGLLLLVFVDRNVIAQGTPTYNPETISLWQVILLEMITTFFLLYVIWGLAVDPRGPKPVAIYIGLAVASSWVFLQEVP